jgi:hypothetical protein
MDTMTSADDVHRLHREGFSIRAIAKRLGLSRMKVHRVLMAAGNAVVTEDEDGGEVFDDAERVVVPPLTYVGTERHNGKLYARWVDTVGPVNELEIYRYRFRDGSEGDAELEADMARQLLAAGWWQLDHGGYHAEWMPPPKPERPECGCALCRCPATVWSYTPHDRRALAGEPYGVA